VNNSESVFWDGWECGDIENVVGHMNWAHKNGVLFILNSTGLVFIPKGEYVEVNKSGDVIGKIIPEQLDASIIKSANKLIK